jgi:D-inositol-3-phosphate glycosyltransferase
MLPLYYRAADALLVCSRSESFGLVALEAQSCGIPVIGTKVGGLPDLVGDGSSGVLVDDRDPSHVSEQIGRLLSEPARAAAFGAAARQRALRFSWKTMAEEFLALYECLIREESPEACTC